LNRARKWDLEDLKYKNTQALATRESSDPEDLADTEFNVFPNPHVPGSMTMLGLVRTANSLTDTSDALEKTKLTALNFLSTEIFPPTSIAVHAIIASADTRFQVANYGESLLKRLDKSIDWNNSSLISSLYILYLGSLTPYNLTPCEKFKNPSNTRIRLKLMPCFVKSRDLVNLGMLAEKVFNDCLWGVLSNSKLKHLGINFLHHIAYNATKEKLVPVGDKLFSGVIKVWMAFISQLLLIEIKNRH